MQSKLLSGNAWRLRLNAPVAQRTEQGASNASTGVRLFSGVPIGNARVPLGAARPKVHFGTVKLGRRALPYLERS